MNKPAAKPELPRLAYTINEVLKSVGCGRTRLFAEMRAKRLRTMRVGRRVLIRAEALQEWLASCEQK